MNSIDIPPPAQVFGLATLHYTARCLQIVAKLGVADHVNDTPKPAAEIAAAAGVNPDALHRMLRLLAMHGVFRLSEGGFAHSELSALLRSDHPMSMRAFATMMADATNWQSLQQLEHSLLTGGAAAEIAFPNGVWAYYRENPEAARAFDAAMTAKSQGQIAALLGAFDFAGVKTLADIGGGRGHFLRAVLDAHPQLKGVLFDQPDVIAAALEHPRMAKVAGDFFQGGLPAADCYLMTNVIHDWADAQAVAILKAAREAAPEGARLMLLEFALPEDETPAPAKVVDIIMLTVTGGRERTGAEYAALFSRAGWVSEGVLPLDGGAALFLARAA